MNPPRAALPLAVLTLFAALALLAAGEKGPAGPGSVPAVPPAPVPATPPAPDRVLVAAVQTPSAMGDVDGNSKRLERLVREAAGKGAKIVVLPEASVTGYLSEDMKTNWRIPGRPIKEGFTGMSPEKAAVVVPGPVTDRFAALSKDLGIYIAVPFVEREPATGRYFNTVCLADPAGKIRLHYRKLTPWPHPAVSWARGGDRGLAFTDTPYGRLGLLICFDIHTWPRWLALEKTDILLYPIAWVEDKDSTWFEQELPAIAREHDLAIVGANWSVEKEQPWHGYGQTRVIDRGGKILSKAATKTGEEIVYAELPVGKPGAASAK